MTKCFIQHLSENAIQYLYYSEKKREYKIGIHLQSDKIVWLNSGIPESVHHFTLVQNSELLSNLFSDELVLFDKAYIRETCFTILLNLQQ